MTPIDNGNHYSEKMRVYDTLMPEQQFQARLGAAAPEMFVLLSLAVHATDLTGDQWRQDAAKLIGRIENGTLA